MNLSCENLEASGLSALFGKLPELTPDRPIAVAISGGPDSMALCRILSQCAERQNGPTIHALTVDHGLRDESKDEAVQVGRWLDGWPHVHHHILTRDTEGVKATRIMESARDDRYAMLASYCHQNNIDQLFVAHHLDDQAETFLFRLAKGSGLNGLAGIQPVRSYDDKLDIVRPFLDVEKTVLIGFCKEQDIPFISDPSNDDSAYARVRLRKAHTVLEEEGLSAKRLAVTASRLRRAREALNEYTAIVWQTALEEEIGEDDASARLVFSYDSLKDAPEEIRIRIFTRALEALSPALDYGPRLEKLEQLCQRIFADRDYIAATLGGCIFRYDRKKQLLLIEKEDKRE